MLRGQGINRRSAVALPQAEANHGRSDRGRIDAHGHRKLNVAGRETAEGDQAKNEAGHRSASENQKFVSRGSVPGAKRGRIELTDGPILATAPRGRISGFRGCRWPVGAAMRASYSTSAGGCISGTSVMARFSAHARCNCPRCRSCRRCEHRHRAGGPVSS